MLTRYETDEALRSYDCYITMEELVELFEALMSSGLHVDSQEVKRFKAKRNGRTVVIAQESHKQTAR